MHKRRMIKMLEDANAALECVGFQNDTGLIGQLILASAIESSGSLVSDSIDKLDKLALELGSVADSISTVAANLPKTD